MDAEPIAIDHPDPTIIDFVEKSGPVPHGTSARFEPLPGGVSSDIWLVHEPSLEPHLNRDRPEVA
jgi:hypothetical protein